ncbi:hypothetical protein CMO89_03010 [Candidatus Woesearchaeota archaeon]|nr:hypothetical protein [Candidatus Woesearchaeota archaeon]|tara:strand:+ start:4740 stop:5264 length:525 start_codon:yes stop_codon:yes gene_type:complete
MAAEGFPRYNHLTSSRTVHLKMKPKEEIEYINKLFKLLNIKCSIVCSKSDNEWISCVSGQSELRKLSDFDIFKLTKERKNRFNEMIISYKREQTKIGEVTEFYLTKLKDFQEEATAPKLARFIRRGRTRTINVLRGLQKEGLIEGKRIRKTGRPFVFEITEKGNKLLDNFSKGL